MTVTRKNPRCACVLHSPYLVGVGIGGWYPSRRMISLSFWGKLWKGAEFLLTAQDTIEDMGCTARSEPVREFRKALICLRKHGDCVDWYCCSENVGSRKITTSVFSWANHRVFSCCLYWMDAYHVVEPRYENAVNLNVDDSSCWSRRSVPLSGSIIQSESSKVEERTTSRGVSSTLRTAVFPFTCTVLVVSLLVKHDNQNICDNDNVRCSIFVQCLLGVFVFV